MVKWEYKVIKLFSIVHINEERRHEDIVRENSDTLEIYGGEGWELISVDNGIAYFKRPITEVFYIVSQSPFNPDEKIVRWKAEVK